MILNNPLIRRYRYSLMRPQQLWIYIGIYTAIVVLLLYINYTLYKYQDVFSSSASFFRIVCYQFLVLQALLLWVWGAYNSGSAITNEITGNSYDFFRMLPVSAGQKAVGILVGKNLIVLLLSFINLIFCVVLGLLGREDNSWMGQSFLILLTVAVLINSVALLSSIKPLGKKKKNNIATIILVAFFLGPFLIRLVLSMVRGRRMFRRIMGSFYGFELPMMVLISLIALYFSCWSIKGILRKFNLEDEPLFNRIGAYLFMVGYEFVLLGVLYTRLVEWARVINYSFWLISLLPVLAVPLWSLRNFDKYLEYSGLIRNKSDSNIKIILRMLMYSNLSLCFGLFTIWLIGSVGTTLSTKLNLPLNIYMIVVIFSFYLFLFLMLELFVLYTSASSKIGLLLAFICGVYIILPLIFNGVLDRETLYLYSPVGFLWEVFRKPQEEFVVRNSIWIINSIFCIVPVLLIRKRYLYILSTREKM